jgi:hypothetical protein
MTMKVTAGTGGGGADPNKGVSGAVDGNGKATVTEGAGKGSGEAVARPEWLPAEFGTAEEFKAFWDKQGAPAAKAAKEAAEKAAKEATEATAQKATDQKVDLPSLEKEWKDSGGKLSEKSLAALKQAGITEEAITDYIDARQKTATLRDTLAETHVGGKENLNNLLKWAGDNYSDKQIEDFNKALTDLKNDDGAKEALDLLQMRYQKVHGKQGQSVTASAEQVAPAGVQPIADMNELRELQSNPKYKKGDKAFHKMVDDRLKASPHLYR